MRRHERLIEDFLEQRAKSSNMVRHTRDIGMLGLGCEISRMQ